MEDDVSPGSSTYSSESEAGKNRGGQPCRGRRNNNNVFKYFFQSSFNCLSLLQSVSTGAASFKPLSSNLSFTVSKTPSLSPPNTACASKFVQKSANYDCGDKNVKLYINWCIIFGLDLCYTFSKHEMPQNVNFLQIIGHFKTSTKTSKPRCQMVTRHQLRQSQN